MDSEEIIYNNEGALYNLYNFKLDTERKKGIVVRKN